MLIPSPVAIQSKKIVTPKLAQLNAKKAAIAPICRKTKVVTVGQFSLWLLWMSITGVFTDPQV